MARSAFSLALLGAWCDKCGLGVTPDTRGAVRSSRHKEVVFAGMLRCHLGDEMPEQWALMDPDVQKQFFASVVQAKDSAGLLR